MKVGDYEIAEGARVYCDIEWKDGRRTKSEGALKFVLGDKAYVETTLGVAEVDVDTIEPVDEPVMHEHAWTPLEGAFNRYTCACGVTGYRKRGAGIVPHKDHLHRPSRSNRGSQSHPQPPRREPAHATSRWGALSPKEWRRHVDAVAKEHGATVENRGHKLVIVLPAGGQVYCASTPSHPAPDRVRRDIRRELARGTRRPR